MNPGRERNQTTCSGSFEVGSTNQDRVRKGLGSSGERPSGICLTDSGSRLFISIEFNGESVLRHDGCQIQQMRVSAPEAAARSLKSDDNTLVVPTYDLLRVHLHLCAASLELERVPNPLNFLERGTFHLGILQVESL